MTVAGSLPWNCRNCQKVSPVPARRRPWMPCATVLATCKASRTSSGRRSASACASPSRLKTLLWPPPAVVVGEPCAATPSLQRFCQAINHPGRGLAFGARGKRQGHPVLEDRLGKRDYVV